MFSESSLTCGLRSDEDDVKTGCKNVKLFFVEPLAHHNPICDVQGENYAGRLSGISHFFIYFHMAVLLRPTRLPTSALFQSDL